MKIQLCLVKISEQRYCLYNQP